MYTKLPIVLGSVSQHRVKSTPRWYRKQGVEMVHPEKMAIARDIPRANPQAIPGAAIRLLQHLTSCIGLLQHLLSCRCAHQRTCL